MKNDDKINQLAQIYEVGIKSIVDFRKVFMPAPNEYDPAPFHHRWSEILLSGDKHFAIEGYRESGKSVLVMRAFPIYCLVYPSEKLNYIIFITANAKKGTKALRDMKDEYLANPILSANLVTIKEDNVDAFCAVVKDIRGNHHEVRIEVYGKGASIRGAVYKQRRPKVVVMDDVQDTDDAKSDTTLENDWNWFLSDIIFLGDKSRIFMIGNNLGESCLIERVFNNKNELNFEIMKVPCYESYEDKDGMEVRRPTWEARNTIEDIDNERQNFQVMGKVDIWYREKMCIPMAPDSQIFKAEYLRYYDKTKMKLSDLNIFTTVDLAIGKKIRNDFTCIITVGVNRENHWFILDCRLGRFDPTETIDQLFDVVSKNKPLIVGIERVAFQSVLEHFIVKEMPERGVFFRIEGLEAKGQKESRIEMLQPRFRAGTIWLPGSRQYVNGKYTWIGDGDWQAEFKSEYNAFPNSLHDDVLDAMAYIEQIAKKPTAAKQRAQYKNMRIAGTA